MSEIENNASLTVEKEEEAGELAKLLLDGTATEEQIGVACKNLQLGIAVPLIVRTRKFIDNDFNRYVKISDKLFETLEQNLEAGLADMESPEILNFIQTISKNQVAMLDLQRKIALQVKDMMPGQVLSTEEKSLLQLLKSFKSQEEKEEFIALVNQYSQSKKSPYIEESDKEENRGAETDDVKMQEGEKNDLEFD